MRRKALLALCLGLVATSGAPAAYAGPPLLALVGNGTTESLAWLDSTTLEPLPGRRPVYVGLHDIPHAFSPNSALLALGSGRTTSIVVVDVRAMRQIGKLETRSTIALAWLSARRLLLIEHAFGLPKARVILVSTNGLRSVSQWQLPAATNVVGIASSRGTATLLLSPAERIGPARLAVVDARGVRTVTLDSIDAGATAFDPAAPDTLLRSAHPGLALDPAGSRAIVVPGAGSVAEIELSGLSVEYHALEETGARRTADGGPGVEAPSEAVYRQAAWIGHGTVAVSGENWQSLETPNGFVFRTSPLGLRLIDTRTWSVRTLDEAATSFRRSGSLVVGMSFDPARMAVYDRDGRALSRLRFREAHGIQLGGPRAYITFGNEYRRHRVRIVDLRTGAPVRTVSVPGWFFPLSRSLPQACWC